MRSNLKSSRQKLFVERQRVNARCDAWAERAVRYRQAGELAKAERAELQAVRCLQRIKQLEDRSRAADRSAP